MERPKSNSFKKWEALEEWNFFIIGVLAHVVAIAFLFLFVRLTEQAIWLIFFTCQVSCHVLLMVFYRFLTRKIYWVYWHGLEQASLALTFSIFSSIFGRSLSYPTGANSFSPLLVCIFSGFTLSFLARAIIEARKIFYHCATFSNTSLEPEPQLSESEDVKAARWNRREAWVGGIVFVLLLALFIADAVFFPESYTLFLCAFAWSIWRLAAFWENSLAREVRAYTFLTVVEPGAPMGAWAVGLEDRVARMKKYSVYFVGLLLIFYLGALALFLKFISATILSPLLN